MTDKKPIQKSEGRKAESLTLRILRCTRYPRYIAYGVGIFYVLLLLTNTSFPVLNPRQPAPLPFNWIITYPPSPPNSVKVSSGSSMIVIINVSAPDAFADGREIIVNARGAENAKFVDTVRDVTLGFTGAYWYPVTPGGFQVSPCGGATIYPNGTDGDGLVWFIPDGDPIDHRYMYLKGDNKSVTFRTEGNYPLSIIINYNNGSDPSIYTFPEFSVQIRSSENLGQNRQNQALWAIAIVGFFFTVLDLVPKLPINPKKKATTSENEESMSLDARFGFGLGWVGIKLYPNNNRRQVYDVG